MITKEHIDSTLNQAIEAREQEVFGYEFNIKNFKMMLERLPRVGEVRPADALDAAKHDFRDELMERLVAEKMQLQRARLVLEVLLEQKTS